MPIHVELTYDRGSGLTNRLARAYARLAENPDVPAAAGVDEFKAVYDIRSAIVHGRSYDRDESPTNLTDLIRCSNILRQLWRATLESEKTFCLLESDDEARRAFFEGS